MLVILSLKEEAETRILHVKQHSSGELLFFKKTFSGFKCEGAYLS
jgi:hypothetical protein